MLDKIQINDKEIVWPVDWDEDYKNVETKNQTEAGTSQYVVTRSGVLSVSVKYNNLNEEWASTLKKFSKEDTVEVKHYDVESKGYVTNMMRMENFKTSKVQYSEEVEDYHGLWDVSFDLEEI